MNIINFQKAREKQEKEKEKKRGLLERLNEPYDKREPRIIYLPAYLQTRSGEYKGVLESPVFMSFFLAERVGKFMENMIL